MISTESFEINGREYKPRSRPIAVICADGSADEYFDTALVRGLMPNLAKAINQGFRGFARGALPSFTNVNNCSLVTGVPPAVHGVCGNYFFDREAGEEVMMNSPKFLRSETILAAAAKAGRKVSMITAKDKLLRLLTQGLTGIAFSSEKAAEATLETNGITDLESVVGRPYPNIYSGDASVYVLAAGAALAERGLSDFLYLSLTDFIQHTYAPDEEGALAFYAALDREMGRLMAAGCVLAITADHGMNAKHGSDRSPNVIYLETLLNEKVAEGHRVILPITDPYVKHHGALGSFAVVHTPASGNVQESLEFIAGLEGVTEVYRREEAARRLELPEDRLGEIVALSGRDWVLGRTTAHHDLSQLEAPLRSHGGRYEEMVPLIISEPLSDAYRWKAMGDIRNFDIFDVAINGIA